MEKDKKNISQKTFGALEKKRYSQQIAQLIYEKILDSEFKKGERLPCERELAKDFQVSRTVIREAIRELELTGVVSVKKGAKGGIFIDHAYHRPFMDSLQRLISSGMITVSHILEVRLLIEPYITVQAALHSKKEDLEALRNLLEDSAQHKNDAAILKRNNFEFHILIGRAAGNPIFSIFMESVMEVLERLSYDFVVLSVERSFLKSHIEIFRAIDAKKKDKIKKLVEDDILDVDKKFGAFLKNKEGSG